MFKIIPQMSTPDLQTFYFLQTPGKKRLDKLKMGKSLTSHVLTQKMVE